MSLVSGNTRFMRIFVGFSGSRGSLERGRQTTVGLSKTAICSIFALYFFISFGGKAKVMVCGHLDDKPTGRKSTGRLTNWATTNWATRVGQLQGDNVSRCWFKFNVNRESTVWVKKIPPPRFSDIFSQTVGNFWSKFYVPIIRSYLR